MIATGVPGVQLRPERFTAAAVLLRRAISALAVDLSYCRLDGPPVIARDTIERAGYAETFPHLLGSVFGYDRKPSDLVMLPAACYHLYPLLAGESLTEPGAFQITATCFRNEQTSEPGRLRSFQMLEYVHVGAADDCETWRDGWLERVGGWLRSIGLDLVVEVADDPFFGPGARLLRSSQRAQQLKFELRAPIAGVRQAVVSSNYHKDHFGTGFDISVDKSPAHSACTAFGIDRLVLALTERHGWDPAGWPAAVQPLDSHS